MVELVTELSRDVLFAQRLLKDRRELIFGRGDTGRERRALLEVELGELGLDRLPVGELVTELFRDVLLAQRFRVACVHHIEFCRSGCDICVKILERMCRHMMCVLKCGIRKGAVVCA